MALLVWGSLAGTGPAAASPFDPPAPSLPAVKVVPTNWTPKFPIPYDETRKDVTDADINAQREMCQWFTSIYVELIRQVDEFGFNLLAASNDWTVGQVQAQADAVAANVEASVVWLAPRTLALTQTQDFAGNSYFPLYQGESFYRLWQHLSNVGIGIRARNTAWIYGPSVQRTRHWGSKINRSHVCD
ncbi:hypothetical protein [Mycolicibacterium sp. P9-22]|uniref:hypothetical protein n=1 Tax=Mycolicibacterium sp. P9-22 TaxID=2024613 RepID=UPI0011EEC68A|nr:hypothetical protein [Mycolicibacterium sp. P9-22]KAA0110017.1 hypothetical protein CIW51_30510 [Mycolicibacterium sp. P9-22]